MQIALKSFKTSRLAFRVRVLYFGIPLVAIAIMLAISIMIYSQVAADNAQQLSRQYSIEAASNFQTATGPHFILMQQLARSTTISRWLANENDPFIRTIAFNEIMGYAVFAPEIYLMFTVYESLNGYDFTTDLTAEQFLPWGQLAGGDVSQWFYDTRDADVPFILNIQRTRPDDGHFYHYVWSNHRMYYGGVFVGVVTVGSPFDRVFHAVFGDFDAANRRGYILDNMGNVRADSLQLLEIFDTGLPTFPSMPELYDNPDMYSYLHVHLGKLYSGIFQPEYYALSAIPLRGSFRYASFAPIIGTNWSVAVLSGYTVFDDTRYLPLMLAGLAVLVLSILLGNALLPGMVLMPLLKLTDSAAASLDSPNSEDIYGLDRDDEIGDLARTIHEARDVLRSREADERAKILVNSSQIACFLHDESYIPVDCNQAALNLFIKRPGESVGETYPDDKDLTTCTLEEGCNLSDPRNSCDRDDCYIRRCLIENFFYIFPGYAERAEEIKAFITECCLEASKHGTKRFEYTLTTLYREEIPCEVTIVSVMYKQSQGYAAYIQDLRERKRMELAEEESRAKTRFLTRMSHEIRTPMNSVMGITQIELQKNGHPDDTREAFLRIFTSSKLLLGIINDILDLSKVEAGRLDITPAVYETSSMITDTTQLNLMYIGGKNINFNVQVDEHLPMTMIGDELRIKQVLNNILSNAFKYTDYGDITLSFKAEPAAEPESVVLLVTVSDTGRGMTPSQIENLFGKDPTLFNPEAGESIDGSGLSLSISYSLLKLMGGTVSVTSRPGHGSTFCIGIPQKRKGGEVLGREAAESLRRLEAVQSHMRNPSRQVCEPMPYGRVLIVDDVESNLYVAKGLLRPYKLHVETVDSGFKAIDKVNAGHVYDIIFMDYMMPEMDGIEATRKLIEHGYCHPVIALTANATVNAAEMFLPKGFADFISKPIDPAKLEACLLRFIRDKQLPETLMAARAAHRHSQPEGEASPGLSARLVKSFFADAARALEVLEPMPDAGEMHGAYLKAYTIQTHAMKSALHNIGRTKLSRDAATLEQAGRDNNTAVITAQTPLFIANIRAVVEELSSAPSAAPPATETAAAADPAALREQFLAIAAACDVYDKAAVKSALSFLHELPLPPQAASCLEEIDSHIIVSDFEEAAVIARQAADTLS